MNLKPKTYRSNGKLLLTGEYVVLDGAEALAIPTKYGQSLTVEKNNSNKIVWKSYNELGDIWFEDEFLIKDNSSLLNVTAKKNNYVSERLLQVLSEAQRLNLGFLNSNQGYSITTHQDFNRLWGLGTSSTLINNIADWANVNPYQLLEKTFGGSGYDIACAKHNTPIIYQLDASKLPIVKTVVFNPSFKDQLYFVYLNQKQNSRNGIAAYKKQTKIRNTTLKDINKITKAITICNSLIEFEDLIVQHENIIAQLLNQDTIKSIYFNDFKGAVKSLGAWGGDFVLVTSDTNPTSYFKSKGFETIIPYTEMVLN